MGKNDIAIKVEDVSVVFNLSKEKLDSLKEYVIKVIQRKVKLRIRYLK